MKRSFDSHFSSSHAPDWDLRRWLWETGRKIAFSEERDGISNIDSTQTQRRLIWARRKSLKLYQQQLNSNSVQQKSQKSEWKKKCRKVLLTQLYFPTVSTSQKSSFCASSFEWKNAGEKNSNCFHLCSHGNLIGRKSDSLAIRRKLRSFFLLVSCSWLVKITQFTFFS